jgi:hypothetical protein
MPARNVDAIGMIAVPYPGAPLELSPAGRGMIRARDNEPIMWLRDDACRHSAARLIPFLAYRFPLVWSAVPRICASNDLCERADLQK